MMEEGQRKYIQLMLALNWILIAEGSSATGGRNSSNIFGVGASSYNVGIAVAVTAMAGLALAATLVYSRRGSLKSPWSHRRRKHVLLPNQWRSLFTPDGKFSDGGVKFLKKVRSGGVDPSIRAEVWPFLLGVYDFNSSKDERDAVRTEKRKEYENLRQQCRQRFKSCSESLKPEKTAGIVNINESADPGQVLDSPLQEEVGSGSISVTTNVTILDSRELNHPIQEGDNIQDPSLQPSDVLLEEVGDKSGITSEEASAGDTESSDSDSSQETETTPLLFSEEVGEARDKQSKENLSHTNREVMSNPHSVEDFETWQRIIRLDAVRANDEWIIYSPSQADVSGIKAQQLACSVGLKDYDHLEPYRIFHAARLVAILEAYALHDPEIGYCQGMSDLLSPIVSVIEDDSEAFWCFVGFMKKARHNFRLDEVGIRRQLNMVSKIIKCKDSHLYKHLEKLEAGDCFFVYRMVVVLFRRELTFEQTLCLWEVMWADQAAIRTGITKSAWGRIRLRAPPTEDLLLYAIAACVLQRRKLIIEKYSSMEEVMRECNSMAGNLDVWKLLDDAHDLVVTLHDKI